MVTPDDKDWTWVLERSCAECGFDAHACAKESVAALVRENATTWERLLDDGVIRPGRPDPSTWSPLEYACHVRDVYGRFRVRIVAMCSEDDPAFENWDQDATAIEDGYERQSPSAVVPELVAAAESLALLLDGIAGADWERPGRRSDGASFTVDSIARYMVHDTVHHIHDVTKHS